ncbi:MAG: mechanosensitive ion channel family protein [Anaerolineales bacterium]|nr:mechanosensitive ion channel family protein [Anaerolineales bacterium]
MPQLISDLFTADLWWSYLFRIGLYLLLAWIVHRLAHRAARRLQALSRFTPPRYRVRPERGKTLETLIASTITFLAFTIAFLLSLSLFVAGDTIVWMVGLFSAAFGLGARPLISDFLTGVSFLFEDPLDVGEKVELVGVEGVVEQVNLRTTLLRAPTGELYVVPNGEIRVIRNFSRGRFSMANVTLKVAADDLAQTLNLLEALGQDAVHLLPNLLEPWQVISETGAIGQQTELTLVTKARFGRAAEMRPRLLAVVQEHLQQNGITLSN